MNGKHIAALPHRPRANPRVAQTTISRRVAVDELKATEPKQDAGGQVGGAQVDARAPNGSGGLTFQCSTLVCPKTRPSGPGGS